MKFLFTVLAFVALTAHGQTLTTRAKLKALTTIPKDKETTWKIHESKAGKPDTTFWKIDYLDYGSPASNYCIITKKGFRVKQFMFVIPTPTPTEPTVYTATATATEDCGPGYSGEPQTATGTATSLISLDDAKIKAALNAQVNAHNLALSKCVLLPPPPVYENSTGLFSDTTVASITKGMTAIHLEKKIRGLTVGSRLMITNDCIRGTVSFGGSWPRKYYKDTVEMNRDTTQRNRLWSWSMSDSLVYRFDKDFNLWHQQSRGSYYFDRAIPLGLKTAVVSISADSLNIVVSDVPQQSGWGRICIDNTIRLQQLVNSGQRVITLPEGKFAFDLLVMLNKSNMVFQGAGDGKTILYSPKGFHSASIQWHGGQYDTIQNLTLIGNHKANGFGFMMDYNPDYPDNSLTEDRWFENPFQFTEALGLFNNNSVAQYMTIIDGLGYAFQSTGTNLVQFCHVILSEGEFTYCGWQGYHAYGAHTLFQYCTFWAPTFTHCFESFDGFSKFENMDITNGCGANNSSPGWYKNIKITITPNSANKYQPGNNLLWDCNQFIAGDSKGTGFLFDGITIINNDNRMVNGIKARDGTKDFTIKNFYFKQKNGVGLEHAYAMELNAENLVMDSVKIEFGWDANVFPCSFAYPDGAAIIGINGLGHATLKNVTSSLIATNTLDLAMTNVQGCVKYRSPDRKQEYIIQQ